MAFRPTAGTRRNPRVELFGSPTPSDADEYELLPESQEEDTPDSGAAFGGINSNNIGPVMQAPSAEATAAAAAAAAALPQMLQENCGFPGAEKKLNILSLCECFGWPDDEPEHDDGAEDEEDSGCEEADDGTALSSREREYRRRLQRQQPEGGSSSPAWRSPASTRMDVGAPSAIPRQTTRQGNTSEFKGSALEELRQQARDLGLRQTNHDRREWCFLCAFPPMHEKTGNQMSKEMDAKLRRTVGHMEHNALVAELQRYYNQKIRAHVDGQPHWCLRSIHEHMLHHVFLKDLACGLIRDTCMSALMHLRQTGLVLRTRITEPLEPAGVNDRRGARDKRSKKPLFSYSISSKGLAAFKQTVDILHKVS